MGLLVDILGKLIEIDFKPQADQMGIFNVKPAKNTYNINLNFTSLEAARAFAEVGVVDEVKIGGTLNFGVKVTAEISLKSTKRDY